MKKFLSLLSAAAIAVVSFATVASAAITEDVFKPEWVIKVDRVEDGYAVVNVSIEVDTELALAKSGAKYTGQAITMTDLILDFNTEIFDSSDIAGDAAFGTMDFNGTNYYVSSLWNNDVNLVKKGTVINHGDFWALLNDPSMTADEINAMDFATVVKAGLQIGDWQKASGNKADIASFYSDGSAEFGCAYAVGTAVEPDPEPVYDYGTVGNDFRGLGSKYWTVDYAAGEFTGNDEISLTDGEKTKTINVKTAEGFDIGGAVSFYVYVLGNDIANVYIVE